MIVTAGDLWTWDDEPVVARVITTNGFVTSNGQAVLGRGVAKQAVDRFGEALKTLLGDYLQRWGNHVHAFQPKPQHGRPYWLITFPVKPELGPNGEPGFKAKAELELISRSANELLMFTLGMLPDEGAIVMPKPGCGNGGLDWSDVAPVLSKELDQQIVFSKILEATGQMADDDVRSIGERFVVIDYIEDGPSELG